MILGIIAMRKDLRPSRTCIAWKPQRYCRQVPHLHCSHARLGGPQLYCLQLTTPDWLNSDFIFLTQSNKFSLRLLLICYFVTINIYIYLWNLITTIFDMFCYNSFLLLFYDKNDKLNSSQDTAGHYFIFPIYMA